MKHLIELRHQPTRRIQVEFHREKTVVEPYLIICESEPFDSQDFRVTQSPYILHTGTFTLVPFT